MKLLPDKNFKENYQKAYAANCEKIITWRKNRKPVSFDAAKQRTVGGFVFGIIIAVLLVISMFLLNVFSEKDKQIVALKAEIETLDFKIQEYQVVDEDSKFAQLEEAVNRIAELQNQYLTGNFDNMSEVDAVRYLGSYNNNWADGLKFIHQPTWTGYIDNSCAFVDKAVMLFILYDASQPLMVVTVQFDLDRFGNLGYMTSMNKVKLL